MQNFCDSKQNPMYVQLEGLSREELIKLLKEAKKESAAKETNAFTQLEWQPHNWTDKNVDDESSSSSNSANAQRDSLIQVFFPNNDMKFKKSS